MNHSKQFDVVVIGGGASGMMAAISASQNGKRVVLLEKNKTLGKKLDITGGGRCNITNAEFDTKKLLTVYGDAAPFLHSPFSQFSVQDTFVFFESRGLPLVVQALKRAFPETEKATDVTNLFKKELEKLGVDVRTETSVKKLIHNGNVITGIETTKGVFVGVSYILATGGLSHPETGATGDGFAFLKDLGHTVKDPTPSIVPLAVPDQWVHKLAGITASNAKVTFLLDDKKQFSKTGKILFTHFGLSGPTILNSAGKVSDLLHAGTVTAFIDICPGDDIGTFDTHAIELFDANKNKNLRTVFKDLVPTGMATVLESHFPDIDFTKKVHSVTKDERKSITKLLKALPITITGLMGFDRAVVADGGIHLSEIDTKTMRSKKISNLYITGDLLDINRPSGGYGLQLCWTTGYVAGKSA
jgi:predicted Rossmann fold flavoprotein